MQCRRKHGNVVSFTDQISLAIWYLEKGVFEYQPDDEGANAETLSFLADAI